MDTATADVGMEQTDAADTHQAGNPVETSTPRLSFADLARRCDELGVAHRIDPSIQHALQSIDGANKSGHWKSVRREKLRQKVKRVIDEAEASSAMDVEATAGSSTMHTGQPRHSAMSRLTLGDVRILSGSGGETPAASSTFSHPQPSPQPPPQPPLLLQPLSQPQPQSAQPDGDDDPRVLAALQAMNDTEFDAFHAWRMANGEPELHLDTVESWHSSPEYDECELQQRVDRWTEAGMPSEPRIYTTTWAEFLEHCGGPRQPGESDAAYQARVSETLRTRTQPLPPPPPSQHLDGQTDDYFDSGADDIWCTGCNEERPGERGLSITREVTQQDCSRCYGSGIRRVNGKPVPCHRHTRRVHLRYCTRCLRSIDQL